MNKIVTSRAVVVVKSFLIKPVFAATESVSYSACLGMSARGTCHLQVCLHD